MTSASATSARNCPVCGSRNSGLSLFCAECGAALNGSSETDTTSFKTTRSGLDAQPTESFVPPSSPPEGDRWQASEGTFSAASPASRSANSLPWTPAAPVSTEQAGNAWTSSAGATAIHPARADEGIRGFVLGALAIVLIVALLGLYLWAGVLSESTRETVSGWFDFIGS